MQATRKGQGRTRQFQLILGYLEAPKTAYEKH
jgi:hypothetical protein